MSSVKSRVIALRERFNKEKVTDEERIAILRELKSIKIDKVTLKATSIGVIINKHRKSENAQLRDAVKAVVSYWKGLVLKGGKSPSTPSTPTPTTPSLPAVPKKSPESKPVVKAEKSEKPARKAASGVKHQLANTGDKIRNKIQQLVFNAFPTEEDLQLRTNLTVQIEAELFKKHGNTGANYKDQFRVIVFNLRDPSNPDLRKNILDSIISPYDLVSKDAQELASDAVQHKREQEAKYAIDAARSDWDQNVKDSGWSDFFKCPECDGDKTKDNQKQIRGADEPMTTFIVCGDCGHRWTDGDH